MSRSNVFNEKSRKLLVAFLFLALFASLAGVAKAAPNALNVQGKLTTSAGVILSGEYNFTFRIYDAYTGGSPLYQTTITTATDARGVYEVALKGIDLPFDRQYYLALKVGSDDEMEPRINLTSAPYAFASNTSAGLNATRAITVNENFNVSALGEVFAAGALWANALRSKTSLEVGGGFANGGLTLTQDGNIIAQGDVLFSGNVSILNITHLSINGSIQPSLDNYFDLGNASSRWRNLNLSGRILAPILEIAENTLFANSLTGMVGIGTPSPSEKLEVIGNVRVSGSLNASSLNASAGFFRSLSTDSLPLGWTNLTLYPASCPPGEFVTGVGDTLTCQSTAETSSAAGGWANDSQTTQTLLNVIVSTNKFVINSTTGNVGIGTSSPSERLVIIGKVNISDSLNVSGTVQAARYFGNGSGLSGITTNVNGTDITVLRFFANNTLFVNGSRVGIGTNSPQSDLHVIGSVNLTGTVSVTGSVRGNGTVPTGMIAFFAATSCPAGWQEYTGGRGRVIVGLVSGGTLEGTVGSAFGDLQQMSHNHTYDDVIAHTHTADPASTASGTESATHSHSADPPSTASGTESASHSHTGPSHTHGAGSLAADSNGAHTHTPMGNSAAGGIASPLSNYDGNSGGAQYSDSTNVAMGATSSNGAHTHTISGTSAADGTGSTGTASATHTHTTDISSFSTATESATHTHTTDISQFNTGSTGITTGSTRNATTTMPYIQLLMCVAP